MELELNDVDAIVELELELSSNGELELELELSSNGEQELKLSSSGELEPYE